MSAIRDCLRENALFSGVSEEDLTNLEQAASIKQFQEFDRIAGGGISADVACLVLEGHVRVVILNDAEEEITLHYHEPGDMFGFAAMYEEFGFLTFIAIDTCKLLVVPHSAVRPFLNTRIASLQELNRFLALRLKQVYREYAKESTLSVKGTEGLPVRLKIREIMSSQLAVCSEQTTVAEAAKMMRDRNIGSLVVKDEREDIKGIITDKDLVTRVIANGIKPETAVVGTFLSHQPVTISHEAFYYEALLAMMNHQVSHLLVVDRSGLSGLLTMKDLLDAKSHRVLALTSQIEHAETFFDVCNLAEPMDKLVDQMKRENLHPSDICKVINDYDDRIHRKILHLAEREMIEEGWGAPPVPYCWLTMGSGGRMEQPRRTDQDNALIYRQPQEEFQEQTELYFAEFTKKVNHALRQFGFPECPGGVMAKNPIWCKSLAAWKHEISDWILQTDSQGIRNLSIFLDFRPVYGTVELAHELKLQVLYMTQNVPSFLHRLATDDLLSPIHLGWFEREVDVKTGVSVHFINAIRILALKHGIAQTNSLERLKALNDAGVFGQQEFERYRNVYEDLMHYRIEGIRTIEMQDLNKRERQRVKQTFQITKELQHFMFHTFQLEGLTL